MVTTKHCAYGFCTNDSRYPDRPGMKGVKFIRFPNPVKKRKECKIWVNSCKRIGFAIHKVTKDTYICSKHFVGGAGPTPANPHPLSATLSKERMEKLVYRARTAPKQRSAPEIKRAKKQNPISVCQESNDSLTSSTTDLICPSVTPAPTPSSLHCSESQTTPATGAISLISTAREVSQKCCESSTTSTSNLFSPIVIATEPAVKRIESATTAARSLIPPAVIATRLAIKCNESVTIPTCRIFPPVVIANTSPVNNNEPVKMAEHSVLPLVVNVTKSAVKYNESVTNYTPTSISTATTTTTKPSLKYSGPVITSTRSLLSTTVARTISSLKSNEYQSSSSPTLISSKNTAASATKDPTKVIVVGPIDKTWKCDLFTSLDKTLFVNSPASLKTWHFCANSNNSRLFSQISDNIVVKQVVIFSSGVYEIYIFGKKYFGVKNDLLRTKHQTASHVIAIQEILYTVNWWSLCKGNDEDMYKNQQYLSTKCPFEMCLSGAMRSPQCALVTEGSPRCEPCTKIRRVVQSRVRRFQTPKEKRNNSCRTIEEVIESDKMNKRELILVKKKLHRLRVRFEKHLEKTNRVESDGELLYDFFKEDETENELMCSNS